MWIHSVPSAMPFFMMIAGQPLAAFNLTVSE